MKLYLHKPSNKTGLEKIYKTAFNEAVELFIVTAYLTDWDSKLKLKKECESFRLIVGKDFGITRKHACKKVMQWLPANRKSQFMVADGISGFHPKSIFWKSRNNKYYSVIGSSNLTKAAFETNYEANIFSELTKKEFVKAKIWVKEIEKLSVVITNSWLKNYQEGKSNPKVTQNTKKGNKFNSDPVVALLLPNPKGAKRQVTERRKRLNNHAEYKKNLLKLFKNCADEKITSKDFYKKLPQFWSENKGNRLQGAGWERKGKNANFQHLAKSFIRICDSPELDRDDAVVQEIDKLTKLKNPARTAFLSEVLCLTFPCSFPILNKPVHTYISYIGLKAPRGASEGSKYLDLAKKLRFSLLQNPKHPAKNLAELDTVIWLEHHDKA